LTIALKKFRRVRSYIGSLHAMPAEGGESDGIIIRAGARKGKSPFRRGDAQRGHTGKAEINAISSTPDPL
jgi:hypothetical protein